LEKFGESNILSDIYDKNIKKNVCFETAIDGDLKDVVIMLYHSTTSNYLVK